MIKKDKFSSFVGIRFEREGVHRWEGVEEVDNLKNKVGYLKHPHRHLFKFDCVFPVTHDDRDKEFIVTKHELIRKVTDAFWDQGWQLCDFGNMSCEMIAKWMLLHFGGMTYCAVSEDGENYAEVFVEDGGEELEEVDCDDENGIDNSKDKGMKVIAILGGIASGKSYIADTMAVNGARIVEIGQIVRDITQQEGRVFDSNLDCKIAERCKELYEQAKDQGFNTIIFVGPRTHYVMQSLQWLNKDNFKSYVVMASVEERRKRFYNAARSKDGGMSFEDACLEDAKLGVNKLISHALQNWYGNCEVIDNN